MTGQAAEQRLTVAYGVNCGFLRQDYLAPSGAKEPFARGFSAAPSGALQDGWLPAKAGWRQMMAPPQAVARRILVALRKEPGNGSNPVPKSYASERAHSAKPGPVYPTRACH